MLGLETKILMDWTKEHLTITLSALNLPSTSRNKGRFT